MKEHLTGFAEPKHLFLTLFMFVAMYGINASSQEAQTICLDEILTVGKNDSLSLFQWAGLCTDDAQNIYVTDMIDNRVKKFSANGKGLLSKDIKTVGGDSFDAVRLIAFCDGFLYLIDQNRPGIKILDSNLRYKGQIDIPHQIVDFKVVNRNLIFYEPFSLTGAMKIIAIDSLGKIVNQYKPPTAGKGGIYNLAIFDCSSTNVFHFFCRFKDLGFQYDLINGVRWQRSYHGGKKGESGKLLIFDMPKTVFFLDIAFDTFDNLFVLQGHLAEHPNRDIMVIDRTGKVSRLLTLNDTSHLIHIDEFNNLYARAEKGTLVKKYRISYR